MDKRCFNKAEAMEYLGIKRRAFETNILPLIQDKGVRIGTCFVFERLDLDAAWDSYKMNIGSERPDTSKGETKWDAPRQPASKKRGPVMMSTKSTKASDFASVASKILKQHKHG
jgi:hypothetical protein